MGTIVRLVLIRAFSSVFEDLLGSIRGFIGDYRWPITALSIVLVAFTIWSDRRGGRDGIGDLVNLEKGISDAEAELEAGATWTPPTPSRPNEHGPTVTAPAVPAASHLPPPTTLQRNLVFGAIGAAIVLGWIGDAFWASLVDRSPLTLLLLNAKPRYQILTVNELDALGVPTPWRCSGSCAPSRCCG